MSNRLKIWWEERKAKHYLKSHWHLIADVILLFIIIALVINLIVIKQTAKPKVDTNPIGHVSKITATTTLESLAVKSEISAVNIYSGKAVNMHLSLENKGVQDLSAINLSPVFLNNSFVVNKIENTSASSSLKIKNNKIVLEKLAVGETVNADILVTLSAKTDSPRAVNWSFKTTYKEGDKTYNNLYDLNTLKLITNLKVKAAAYYNSQLGDQLGSGPIPPIADLPTNYWIFFEIDNNGNDLSNLTVSAKLPESVTLSNGKTLSAGDLIYDESQKRVTWSVKKVSVASGRYQAGFEIQLLPTTKQIGLKPLLLSNISYLATDAYTGERLSGKLPYIDTELPSDAINQGQAKVQK